MVNASFVTSLKESASINAYISRFITLKHASGSKSKGKCPFHQEKTPSFFVDEAAGFFHCFGCGEGGDVLKFAQMINNISFQEAIEDVANYFNIEVPKEQSKDLKQYAEEQNVYSMMNEAADFFKHNLQQSYAAEVNQYLRKKRKLNSSIIGFFGIGFASSNVSLSKHLLQKKYSPTDIVAYSLGRKFNNNIIDFFYNRFVIPVKDFSGRVVAFGARCLDGSNPKYINSAGSGIFNKSQIIFNFHTAAPWVRQKKLHFILVEGYMDVIKMAQYGFYGAIATMGTATTQFQVKKILANDQSPVVCFNSDEAGKKAMYKIAQIIMQSLTDTSRNFRFYILKGYNDIDDMLDASSDLDSETSGKRLINNILTQTISLEDYAFNYLRQEQDLNKPDQMAIFIKNCYAFANLATDEIIKVSYKNFFRGKIKTLMQETKKNNYQQVKTLDRSLIDIVAQISWIIIHARETIDPADLFDTIALLNEPVGNSLTSLWYATESRLSEEEALKEIENDAISAKVKVISERGYQRGSDITHTSAAIIILELQLALVKGEMESVSDPNYVEEMTNKAQSIQNKIYNLSDQV